MLNLNLIKTILLTALSSSIISTSLLQKIKESTKSKKHMFIKSFIISMIIGITFTLSFSKIEFKYSLWVGLISFIGADTIYKAFENKIFASLSALEKIIYIERDDKKWN